VTIGILEVQAAAAVTVVDDAALPPAGVGPVGHALVADAAEGSVELLVADQERVVLGGDRPAGFGEVERDIVVGRYHEEMPERGRRRQAEDPAEERR